MYHDYNDDSVDLIELFDLVNLVNLTDLIDLVDVIDHIELGKHDTLANTVNYVDHDFRITKDDIYSFMNYLYR